MTSLTREVSAIPSLNTEKLYINLKLINEDSIKELSDKEKVLTMQILLKLLSNNDLSIRMKALDLLNLILKNLKENCDKESSRKELQHFVKFFEEFLSTKLK